MSAGCVCTGKMGNTGSPSVKPFGVPAGLYMVPILANDGTRNGLDLTSATLGADLLEKINHTDPSKRFYPYLGLTGVDLGSPTPKYETLDNDERELLSKGIRTVKFDVRSVTEQFYDKTSSACVDFGVIWVDVCGNLKGEKEGENFYPILVNKGSFNSVFVPSTNAASTKVEFEMDYSINVNDGKQWMLSITDFGIFNPLQLKGMIDVNFVIVEVVDGENFTVDAEMDYGFANNPIAWTGAGAANFSLYNNTTAASVTIAAAVESVIVPGRYAIAVTAPITDTDSVTLDAFKAATGNLMNGFEGVDNTFVYTY